jgi:hypothetical protein
MPRKWIRPRRRVFYGGGRTHQGTALVKGFYINADSQIKDGYFEMLGSENFYNQRWPS